MWKSLYGAHDTNIIRDSEIESKLTVGLRVPCVKLILRDHTLKIAFRSFSFSLSRTLSAFMIILSNKATSLISPLYAALIAIFHSTSYNIDIVFDLFNLSTEFFTSLILFLISRRLICFFKIFWFFFNNVMLFS